MRMSWVAAGAATALTLGLVVPAGAADDPSTPPLSPRGLMPPAPASIQPESAPPLTADGGSRKWLSARQSRSGNSLAMPGVRSLGRITAKDFGIHSYVGKPLVPAGSIRLQCAPLWQELNPAPGKYKWQMMGFWLSHVRPTGITDLQFSICGTPAWASKPLPHPEVDTYWGAGAPKQMSYWRTFVTELVKRFGHEISVYEAWNEATSPYQWQGTAAELATMTQILDEVVDRYDPTATVLAANVQTAEQSAWFNSFFPAYMKELKARGWPVDAITIHTYAGGATTTRNQALAKRPEVLTNVLRYVQRYDMPRRVGIWDTETNYLGPTRSARWSQAYLARTYLDSWRFGVRRTYWYTWTLKPYDWLGVDLTPRSAARSAFTTLVGWTVGAKFKGCVGRSGVQQCRFTRSGRSFTIAYSDTMRAHRIALKGKKTVCPVGGGSCKRVKKSLKVDYLPVRIS